MKFIKQQKNKLLIFLTLILNFFININISNAQNWDAIKNIFGGSSINIIGTILGGAIGFLMFVISYIISVIAGFIISLEAFLIEITLQLNSQVIQNEFVQSGFLISLSITNLIFVGGIIVIAIATILRLESYGIKQTLWKLIVMAVLVNFSLTISGAIINISDNFSNYFLDSINPEVGPNGEQTTSKYGAFATAISGAFTPQRFFLNSTSSMSGNSLNISEKTRQEDLAAMAGGSLAGIIKPIISVFFVIIFLINIIIVLGTLFIMLLIRYVNISFLLILAPLAWAMWIFDKTKSYWSEWWQKFMHWTFFAPLVLFFLYLCLLTLRGTSGGSNSVGGVYFAFDPQRNDALGSVQSFVGSFLGDVGKTILSMIMMIGCVTGALIAADKLGIEGAKAGLNITSGVNKAAGNWWKNKMTNVARKGLNRATGYAGSTITEQPPIYNTGWRRIFNPINKLTYKVGGVAAKIIPEDKKTQLSSIAEKYGPVTRYQERQRKTDLINQYKARLEKINNDLKEAPRLIAEKQNEISKIKEELSSLENEYIKLKENNADKTQLNYIDKQIADKKAELQKGEFYIENLIREKQKEQEQIKKELEELNPSLLKSTLKATKTYFENIQDFASISAKGGYEAFHKGPKKEKEVKKADIEKTGLSSEDISKIGDLLNIKIKIKEKESSPPKENQKK